MKKFQIFAFCIIALIFAGVCMPACCAVDVVEATEAINQAELSLNSAFVAVAEGYKAGADIEELLENLDIAGDFLSEAHMAFRSGDYETANSLAVESGNAVEDIATMANRLMANADNEKTRLLVLTVGGSCIGLILLLVFGIVGWKFL
ncbi:MAG: hypothetical protein JSV20_07270, partial [Candidatus Bathyarchaeota archaeon]